MIPENCDPVQNNKRREQGYIHKEVTSRAYEVYSELYGSSQTLKRLNERGGFGTGELIAFLYAYPFPKEQWNTIVNNVIHNSKNL